MTTIDEVLDRIRSDSANSYELGSRFERLMLAFFRLDRTYVGEFTDVWLWSDWPGNEGKVDTGIDLVAKNARDDGYTAIQCKCYDANTVLTKSDIDSFFTASGKAPFTNRIIVATTSNWSKHAEDALNGQEKPVQRIGLDALEESTVDWNRWDPDHPEALRLRGRKSVRPHQVEAIEAVRKGFATSDRGKLIMACGTGKTFTAQRIAEETVGPGGHVLVLVPSISLLSQTLKEWTADASIPIAPYAICSDSKAGRKGSEEDISPYDLILPATTDPELIVAQYQRQDADNPMSVFFSTYQSLPVITAAQEAGIPEFDLLIADEAHRTTGVTLDGSEDSNFVKVHDNVRVAAKKRLYMTATPRVYSDAAKGKAATADAYVASMDDETIYGPEFHRLGFHEAVQRDLLTDYKVLILAVDEAAVSRAFQRQLSDENNELKLDDATRIVGCINALAKRDVLGDAFDYDPEPMQRAVAFSNTIARSKKFKALFKEIANQWNSTVDPNDKFTTEVEHVDGKFNALQREQLLRWLKAEPPEDTCNILSNARCLTEGVDVPALDAILFLEPRNSMVDVIQAVGRVMRKAGEDKKYGYVVLPVGIPADQTPEQALNDNKRFKAVWQVLNALRSHDDRLNAIINQLELNEQPPDIIDIVPVPGPAIEDDADPTTSEASDGPRQIELGFPVDELRKGIYAKLVLKVGTRHYWEEWATDIAQIASRYQTRITTLVSDPLLGVKPAFDRFVSGLQSTINDSIGSDQAVVMLSQHLITRPIFEVLFSDLDFAASNPVSEIMQEMVDVLDGHALQQETESLKGFYDSVRIRVEGIDNAAGKQKIITELYEGFFSRAFPKVRESLGIVYTPIEIVDFILAAADASLRSHFGGQSLSDEGVSILDPFTGTGTFLVRLLQCGLIRPEDLRRKYAEEMHCNEIVLLAYYIAAINIESAFHDLLLKEVGDSAYSPFDGIVLTDTFQLGERGEGTGNLDVFPVNNRRAERQQTLGIRVIVGNPPYSIGQSSHNDDNQNLSYPRLDAAISSTYSSKSQSKSKRSMKDSYVRALRWASDRIAENPDGGVVAFVTNGSFIESPSFDGLRRSLAEEYHHIYCLNLRGNTYTKGDVALREGGQIFSSGSRVTIAITVLVREPRPVPSTGAVINYCDIGDYLDRAQKLAKVQAFANSDDCLMEVPWHRVLPSERAEWINQQSSDFDELVPLWGEKDEKGIFDSRTYGLFTARDAWNYNSSSHALLANYRRMIDFYNGSVDRFIDDNPGIKGRQKERVQVFRTQANLDPKRFSWSRSAENAAVQGRHWGADGPDLREALYRPFSRQFVNFADDVNDDRSRLTRVFPSPDSSNLVIVTSGRGTKTSFSALMVDTLFDLQFLGNARAYPRFTYQSAEVEETLFDSAPRLDNVSSGAIERFSSQLGLPVSADDVFFYIYACFHSPSFLSSFGLELAKSEARVPLPIDSASFQALVSAGKALADLHVRFDSVEPWPAVEVLEFDPQGPSSLRFEKLDYLREGRVPDRSVVVVNSRFRVAGIPLEAFDYKVGGRSPVEWVVDQFKVKVHKASGIVNDWNAWGVEHDNERYVVDLLRSAVTVSMRTQEIVRGMPNPMG